MSKKQCVIIGLGKFGMTLAEELSVQDLEVLAIDMKMELVDEAAKFVTEAVCVDAAHLDKLSELSLNNFDIGIIAIGEDISASLISVIVLKEFNVPYIIAKAKNNIHKKALEKLGVDKIIIPEEEIGIKLAKSLAEE